MNTSNISYIKKCYSCNPRGKVKKHIFEGCETDGFVFHHDMHKRPIILVTPKKHYSTLWELPPSEQVKLFAAVKTFCEFWNISDYQVAFNCGSWQNHDHLHIKIKINEKIINRLRRDHFNRIKRSSEYPPTSAVVVNENKNIEL